MKERGGVNADAPAFDRLVVDRFRDALTRRGKG